MKKLIFAVAIVIVLLLGGAAGYIFLSFKSLVAGLKPRLEQMASEAIGSKFAIDDIDTSIFPGLKLSLKGISADGTKKEGRAEDDLEKFFVKEINLFIDLMGLLSGNLIVKELSVVAPEVNLIKDSRGIRLAGFGFKAETANTADTFANSQRQDKQGSKEGASSEEKSTLVSALPFALALQGLRIDDGVVRLSDQSHGTPKVFEMLDLYLRASATFKEGVVELENLDHGFTIFSGEKIGLTGGGLSFDLSSRNLLVAKPLTLSVADEAFELGGEVNLKDGLGQASLVSDELVLERFSKILVGLADWTGNPLISSLNLEGRVKPNVKIMLHGNDKDPSFVGDFGLVGTGFSLKAADGVGSNTVKDLTGTFLFSGTPDAIKIDSEEITLSASSSSFRGSLPVRLAISDLVANLDLSPLAVRLRLPELIATVDGEQVKLATNIELVNQVLSVADIRLEGFSGILNGDLEFNLSSDKFANQLEAKKINIAELMRFVVGEQADLSGELRYLSGSLSGRLGPELLQTLHGGGEVRLTNLSLKGFNLLREVLAELKSLPFLSGALLSKVPAELQSSIDQDSTPLDDLRVRVNLESGSAFVRDLEAKSLLFNLAGQGELELARNRLNLQTDFAIRPPMSIGLAERVKELRPLLDEQQLLVFPLRIEGVPPKLVVYPDPSKLLEKVGRKLLEQKGQKLLKGLLGF